MAFDIPTAQECEIKISQASNHTGSYRVQFIRPRGDVFDPNASDIYASFSVEMTGTSLIIHLGSGSTPLDARDDHSQRRIREAIEDFKKEN